MHVAPEDVEKSVMFEVTYTSLDHMTVTFEHPVDETMITLEINLSDILAVKCKTFAPPGQDLSGLCKDDIVTTIMRK